MRDFEPGKLPAGLDLGDRFEFEDQSYVVRAVSSGAWITAQVVSPVLTPVEFTDGARGQDASEDHRQRLDDRGGQQADEKEVAVANEVAEESRQTVDGEYGQALMVPGGDPGPAIKSSAPERRPAEADYAECLSILLERQG